MMKLLSKRASILSSTLRNRSDEYKAELISEMETYCIPGFEDGRLHPMIDSSFPISEAGMALERMKNNLNTGKIVLINDF